MKERIIDTMASFVTVPKETNSLLISCQAIVDGTIITYAGLWPTVYRGEADLKVVALGLLVSRMTTHLFTYITRKVQ